MLDMKIHSPNVVVVNAKRSAVGKIPGVLNQIRDVNLLAYVFDSVSTGVHNILDSAIVGSAFPVERDNLCRKAVLVSRLPPLINCITISKTCASSDEALAIAYMQILSGKSQAILVGGCEKVSNSPYILGFMKKRVKDAEKLQLPALSDLKKIVSENDMHYIAEMLAQKQKISRTTQDSYAIKSRAKALNAYKNHRFDNEIVPINYSDNNQELCNDEWVQVDFDEGEIWQSSPIFVKNGTLTKYNTAPMCDAAAAMIVTSYETAKKNNLNYLVEIKDIAWINVSNENMGCAMEQCVKKILEDNHLSKDEIDLYEINESFAAQAIATIQALKINPSRVNVNGGNLAFGYPVGASGLRMCVTLIHEMVRSRAKYGISVMCGGGTMANAVLFQNNLFNY